MRILNLTYLVKSAPQTASISSLMKSSTPVKKSFISQKSIAHQNCGVSKMKLQIRSLIFGGDVIQRGEWPWLVAIYLSEMFGLSFACGGNLISSKAVLTAAHCVRTANKYYQPREILLYFGHFNRLDWTEDDSIRQRPAEIFIHSDYKRGRHSKDADLAILITRESVEFNKFIQPVCLWSADDDGEESEDVKGIVVGWGKESAGQAVSTMPKKIELPIIEANHCMERSEKLAPLLSNRTFCGGTLDGNGPCYGDSGRL